MPPQLHQVCAKHVARLSLAKISLVYPLRKSVCSNSSRREFCLYFCRPCSPVSFSTGSKSFTHLAQLPASATKMKFSVSFILSLLVTCTSGRPEIAPAREVRDVVTPTPSSVSSPQPGPSAPAHVHGSNYRRVPRRWVVNRPDHRVVKPPSLNKRFSPTRTTGPYPEELDAKRPVSSSEEGQSELASQTISSLLSGSHQTASSDHNIPQFFQSTNAKNTSAWTRTGAFTITQVRNPNFSEDDDTRNGLLAMMHAYAKYGTNMTSAIRLAMRLSPAFQRLAKRGFPSPTLTT